MNIYEINQAIDEALNKTTVNEETGEIESTPDFDKIQELQMMQVEKMENVALWIKNMLPDIEALAKEIQTLQKRKKSLENKVARAKEWLIYVSKLTGIDLNTTRVVTAWRHTKAVAVDDINKVPEQYLKFEEPQVMKEIVKRDLKNGIDIPGLHLEENESLIIK